MNIPLHRWIAVAACLAFLCLLLAGLSCSTDSKADSGAAQVKAEVQEAGAQIGSKAKELGQEAVELGHEIGKRGDELIEEGRAAIHKATEPAEDSDQEE